MDGIRGADEEHRVVHHAERDRDPAGDVDGRAEVTGRRDGTLPVPVHVAAAFSGVQAAVAEDLARRGPQPRECESHASSGRPGSPRRQPPR